MKNLHFLAFLIALVVSAPVLAQGQAQLNLPRTILSAGIHQIEAQVARTTEEHAVGLMFRKEMPPNEGMLFVFNAPSKQCFWMKNTSLGLTAAFVADDGTVVNLEDMQANTTESHCSTKPVRYVLEVNQGWFAKKGIKAGARLSGAPFKAAP
jgi:uncharacterized membrane protein (UPF0127 family)